MFRFPDFFTTIAHPSDHDDQMRHGCGVVML
jgi:hypothetical protein